MNTTSHSATMLAVENLAILRGARYLCRDLGFSANAGALVHVRGPNGCGKTSLMRTLVGLSLAEAGRISWFGRPLSTFDTEQRAQFSYLGHNNGLKAGLTPIENLQFSAALQGNEGKTDFRELLLQLEVEAQSDLPCRLLSAGQKRRVALARVASSNASVWILDEPFTSLDVTGIAHVTGLIGEKLKQGGLVIMSSHQEIPLASDRLVTVNMETAA